MTTEERRKAARALQGNPLLSECFDKTIKDCFTAWQAERDREKRDEIWHRVMAVQSMRNEVYAAVKSALRDEQQQTDIG